MFKVGDRIFYPIHGAGTIVAIETKEILGELHEYFVLSLVIKNLMLMVPKKTVENSGLRPVCEEERIDHALEILGYEQSDMSDSWNKRYRDNMDRLKTGDINEISEVVRDLEIRNHLRGLSTGEKRMLGDAKQVLASEISMVKCIDLKDALLLINSSIGSANSKKMPHLSKV